VSDTSGFGSKRAQIIVGEYGVYDNAKENMEKMQNGEGVKANNRVVLGLTKCEEIDIVIDWLAEQHVDEEGFAIEDHGTFYRIDAIGGFDIDCDEIEPFIGHAYNVYDLMVDVTTTIGRAMTLGNKFVMTNELMGLETPIPLMDGQPAAVQA